jgi:hypothetical protein
MAAILLTLIVVAALVGCALVIGNGTATATSRIDRKIDISDTAKIEDIAMSASAPEKGKADRGGVK